MIGETTSKMMSAEEQLALDVLRLNPEIRSAEQLAAAMYADPNKARVARARDLVDQLREKGHSLPF